MAIYKDGDKWRAVYRFTDWIGERKQTQKEKPGAGCALPGKIDRKKLQKTE